MLPWLLLHMTKEKFNDYTKINYSFLKPSQEDYKTFSEYWEAMTNQQDGYLYKKFKYTYGSKL